MQAMDSRAHAPVVIALIEWPAPPSFTEGVSMNVSRMFKRSWQIAVALMVALAAAQVALVSDAQAQA